MHVRGMVVIAGLALAVGCTDFASVDPEECGNFVLEPGEDCDGVSAFGDGTSCGVPGDPDNACFYVCSAEAECPETWSCGNDNRCRRPSGQFVRGEGAPFRFPVETFGIGDVDGDGAADLVGLDSQTIHVRHGDQAGRFPSALEFASPEPTGPPELGTFDHDDLTDIVVPTKAGLFVVLGGGDRTLNPVAYAPFDFGDEPVEVIPVPFSIAELPDLEIVNLLIVANDPVAGALTMVFVDANTNLQIPGLGVEDIPGQIPVTNLDGDVRGEWAIAPEGATAVQVFTSTGVDAALRPVAKQTVATPGPIHLGAMFADIDGDGDDDLLVSFLSALGRPRIAASLNTGGTLAASATVLTVFDRLDGSDPWPLAVGDLNGDGRADLVATDAIVQTAGPTPGLPTGTIATILALDGPWVDATIGDFNADGRPDVAAAVSDALVVDVYLAGAGVPVFFSRFSVSTDGPPKLVRAGDFDGDLVDDVAIVESNLLDDTTDAFTVSFGRVEGGPTSPTLMGEFGVLEQMATFPGLATLLSGLLADSVVLVSRGIDDARSLAVMQGNTSRRMVSPFALDDESDGYIPRQAIFGRLNDDGFTDIVAVAERERTADGIETPIPSLVPPTVWFIPGSDDAGGLDAANVSVEVLPDDNAFALRCSRWTAGDLNLDGADELVGIDGSIECAGGLAAAGPSIMLAANEGQTDPEPLGDGELVTPETVKLSDVDADGDLDLVVVYLGNRDGSEIANAAIEGTGVGIYWNEGAELTISSGFSQITVPADTGRVVSAAPLRLDDDLHQDFVVATERQVYRVTYDPETDRFRPPEPDDPNDPRDLPFVPGTRQVVAGDLNGDGLDDVAVLFGLDVDILLAVPAAPLGDGDGDVPESERGDES